jgi:hypothetical protein
MLILSLIILLLSNSITLRRDKSILYSRATITILVIATLISYDNLNFLFLNKGIGIFSGLFQGIFSGLFHATATTNLYSLDIITSISNVGEDGLSSLLY